MIKAINRVQQIIVYLMYYAIDVYPNMLVALGSIDAQQTRSTEKTYDEVIWLLKYASSNTNVTIRFSSSNMVLHIHSDASYIFDPKSRSRACSHYFLSNHSNLPQQPPSHHDPTQRTHPHCLQDKEPRHGIRC